MPLALTLMLTSVPGAAAGAQLAQKVSAPLLKRGTAVVMLAAAPVLWMGAGKGVPPPMHADASGAAAQEASQLEQRLRALRARNRVDWYALTHDPGAAVANAVKQKKRGRLRKLLICRVLCCFLLPLPHSLALSRARR